MKVLLLALCLAVSVHGVAVANESRHAAIVDMPKVISLTHASPDTWHTLPPVQPNDESTSTARPTFGAPLVFGQVGSLQLRSCTGSTQVPRNGLALVELTLAIPREGD
jgi:hypothetical protein